MPEREGSATTCDGHALFYCLGIVTTTVLSDSAGTGKKGWPSYRRKEDVKVRFAAGLFKWETSRLSRVLIRTQGLVHGVVDSTKLRGNIDRAFGD
jgi:hypothetical protein